MFHQTSLSMKVVLVFCLGFSSIDTLTNFNPVLLTRWNYQELQEWSEHYPSCGGEFQSPINLELAASTPVYHSDMKFGHYNERFREMVTNNGHTVLLSLNQSENKLPYITCGGLNDQFNFVQLHFHWGSDSQQGSEHYINSRPYPAEMHLVHYNTKYNSFTEATGYQDGLAVIGIMIELQSRDNIAFRHLEQFEDIINHDRDKSDYLDVSIPLADLLPDDTTSYYRYNGSLTTPNCNEDVIWTVFDTPIAISERQLNKFRQLRNKEGEPMKDNYRPIQELHGRVVEYRPSKFRIMSEDDFIFYP